ncbi:hypothetical protein AB0J83_09225 [Actinoplanes sp. NPDC049596]|uniref:hypothetical protein n=1 Tax=unclassified Actinoplanes TaxID=2626549 RepID=UPI0034473CD1
MTETEVERRLRVALSARAATITSQDLSPARAPSRPAPARWWLPLTAGLAAAAVSVTMFVLLRPTDPAPTLPATPPSPTAPASPPTPAPATSSPTPPATEPPRADTPSPSSSAATPTATGSIRPSRSPSTVDPAATGADPGPTVDPTPR